MPIIDLDSWSSDTEPIVLRLGGRKWIIKPPTFNAGMRISEAMAAIQREYEHGAIDAPEYAKRALDMILREARFVGIPDFLGRWAVRHLLRRRPAVYQLRAVNELVEHFVASLRLQWAALTGGMENARNTSTKAA